MGKSDRPIYTSQFLKKLMPAYRQGSLDGACVFYCAAMMLEYLGVCTDPWNDAPKKSTRLGQLLAAFGDSGSLLGKGIRYGQFEKIVQKIFPQLEALKSPPRASFADVVSFVRDKVKDDVPVLLAYRWRKGTRLGHCTVAVGTGEKTIYLIDPYEACSEGALYNNYLAVGSRRAANTPKDQEEYPVELQWCRAFRLAS